MIPRFPIGLEFQYYAGKQKQLYKIVDILTTRNSAGDVVHIEYLTTHRFLNQVIPHTLVDTAIARSLSSEQLKIYIK